MSALRLGQKVDIPELDGEWTIWSQSDEAPGAYFAVPALGGGYAVIKATTKRNEAKPVITLIRVEGARA